MLKRSLALLAVVASLCAPAARAEDPVNLGAILPLTGPGGVIGVQEQRGIEFALLRANAAGGVAGHQITLSLEDNQAKPDQSVLSFNKLADLQHVAVIFTGYSGPTLAMAPLATRKKVLLVNAAAQADKLADASPYLINAIPTLHGEIAVLSDYLAHSAKKTTAAILFENDSAGISGRDDFTETFKAAGGKVLATEPVPFGETNYRPALLRLASANAEVLFVVLTGNNAPLADQVAQLQIKATVAGTTFFADPSLIANPAANGWLHSQVRISSPPELQAAFRAKYGSDMEFFASQYYNATNIVLTSLAKVLADKQEVTGTTMRTALLGIRRFDGLVPLEFKTNTASAEVDIMRIDGGHETLLTKAASE
jgi:branched-chain amino acid transport system substrate-binding protein